MAGKSFKNTFIFIEKKGRHFSFIRFFPFIVHCRLSCKKFPAGDGLGFAFIFISKKEGIKEAKFSSYHASNIKNNKSFKSRMD